ncbi:MAG TPA: PhzF family phenazine biosynthesis protein [Rudaea sp.]|nr:PhzF family phenazine biosynthesis protein [Rudaea sp.]
MQNPKQTSAYKQVDVFTSVPFFGNALGVVLDAERLDGADMQRIAAWMNLSETAFVLPPTQAGADYRVRIFTPRSELGFAGHPSVGTAHALLEAGRVAPKPQLVQECAAGLLPMRVLGQDADRSIFVRAPRATMRTHAAVTGATVGAALAIHVSADRSPRLLDLGLTWLICDLGDEACARGLKPDMEAVAALCTNVGAVGIGVFGRARNADYALAVRAFCPADGIPEDPVTGSANAAIGAYLHAAGGLGATGANYRVSQGREIGRDGYVDVRVDRATGDVEIGGQSITCIDGIMNLPPR